MLTFRLVPAGPAAAELGLVVVLAPVAPPSPVEDPLSLDPALACRLIRSCRRLRVLEVVLDLYLSLRASRKVCDTFSRAILVVEGEGTRGEKRSQKKGGKKRQAKGASEPDPTQCKTPTPTQDKDIPVSHFIPHPRITIKLDKSSRWTALSNFVHNAFDELGFGFLGGGRVGVDWYTVGHHTGQLLVSTMLVANLQ